MNKYLFLCGCARSGTSALWRLLTANEKLAIGLERYINRCSEQFGLVPELYKKDRFYSLQEGDTHFKSLSKGGSGAYYTQLEERYESATYVGDKIPRLYNYYNQLFHNFPAAKVIFIYRNVFDVAQSFNNRFNDPEDGWNRDYLKAIKSWNTSLSETLSQLEIRSSNFFCIAYEDLFFKDYDFNHIYNFLEIASNGSLEKRFAVLNKKAQELESKRQMQLSSVQKEEICIKADFTSYNMIAEAAANQ